MRTLLWLCANNLSFDFFYFWLLFAFSRWKEALSLSSSMFFVQARVVQKKNWMKTKTKKKKKKRGVKKLKILLPILIYSSISPTGKATHNSVTENRKQTRQNWNIHLRTQRTELNPTKAKWYITYRTEGKIQATERIATSLTNE